MPRLPFVPHLPVSKLRHKYRSCRLPGEAVRWHALWLLARADPPRTPAEVADLVGLSAVTVRALLHRWNDRGPAAVADGRKGNGARPKLTARRRSALDRALRKRPPDGGLWTGPKVARYARDRWGVGVRPETGWRWLVALGFALKVPRPTHPGSAAPAARRAWKKTCGGGSGG